ncbi:TetR/AcrR family transcriptional regulator [Streptomyces niveus]|uniref:TetR/AcrR family transcriptional regulator n=1 Tax=Streptomyces niveus TaxID=193462 RepID=UPI0036596350
MDQLARHPAGHPEVPPDRIVAMALRIVDEEGAEALSMRALAERLGSGTAMLYRHFGNRAGLVAQAVDHMFGLVELDDQELASASRPQSLRAVAHGMFRALGRHGNAARLLAEQIPVDPNAIALRERCVAIPLKARFEAASLATHAYMTLARYVCGLAIQLNHENDAGTAQRGVGRCPAGRGSGSSPLSTRSRRRCRCLSKRSSPLSWISSSGAEALRDGD